MRFSSRRRSVVIFAILLALGADLALVVVSGGYSLTGSVTPTGFFLRIAILFGCLGLYSRATPPPKNASLRAYVAVLLLLLPLLHYLGYRLRGDALWLYPYARSLVFDHDLDLTNEYRWYAIDHLPGSQPVPETGLARNTFPVGAALLWIPWVELGHVGVAWRNLSGAPTPYDGYAAPYLHAVALGNLLMGWLGLLVVDRLLRRWFSPRLAFAAVMGVALGSFLLWYLAYQPVYTHAPTFLFTALLVERWSRGLESAGEYALYGLLAGIAALVRWQNAVFLLLAGFSLVTRQVERKPHWSEPAGRAAALGTSFFLGALPQLIVWKILFGAFWLGVPLGSEYMAWSAPFPVETLFSSRHGLFSWSPLLILATLGLLGFVRRHPHAGIPAIGMLGVLFYVNSAVADWWAGGSFGARRFDSALPLLALGLAMAFGWIQELVRRRPGVVVAAILAGVVGVNLLLIEQYRKGRLPPDDTISWEVAARGMLEDFFDAVGYPFSFPANWIFALRYDRPKTQYDVLVGKYLFHLQNNLNGFIDLGPEDPPFLGNGWSTLQDWEGQFRSVRVARAPRAGIFVPLARAQTLRMFVRCATPRERDPVWVEVWINGSRLAAFRPTPEMHEHAFTVDRRWWSRLNLVELVSESEGAFLAVDRFRFERVGRR